MRVATATTREGRGMGRRHDRKRGHPIVRMSLRCPEELVGPITAIGSDFTDGALAHLDTSVDARAELGDLWSEVEVRSHRDGITEGQALGRLAREALKRRPRE